MRDRMDDHLIQEPRIRRILRRPLPPSAPPPRREEAPARVPAPRRPQREEHAAD